jgi:hypothetical protein
MQLKTRIMTYLVPHGVDENATDIPCVLRKLRHPLLQSLRTGFSRVFLLLQLSDEIMHVLSGWVARGVVVYVLQNALLLGSSFLKLIDGAHNIRFERRSVVCVLVEGVLVQRVAVDQPSRCNLQGIRSNRGILHLDAGIDLR